MAKITYRNIDGSAPRIVWRGVTFMDGVATEAADESMIEAARENPFFEIADTIASFRKAAKAAPAPDAPVEGEG